MYRLIVVPLLALTIILSLACAQSPPTSTPVPVATESPTRSPLPTPIPTLTAAEQEEYRQSQLATVEASLPTLVATTRPTSTPRPPAPTVWPTPVMVVPTPLPTPVVPVIRVATPRPTVAPPSIPPSPVIALPTFAPPTPTWEPLPTTPPRPIITVPTFAPAPPTWEPLPTVPPAPRVVLVSDFAASCADINSRDESAPGWSFQGWIAEAQAVEPPPVLADWWRAYVNQFALQNPITGPNKQTQEAADDAMWALYVMELDLRDYLVDQGCLTGTDLWLADATVEALTRLNDGFGQGQGVTLEEFADACSDIKLTAPTLDAIEVVPQHLAGWWERLSPPPEVKGYYDAVADFYAEWIETAGGDPQTDVSFDTQMALIEASQALDEDVMETLLARRCVG